MMRIMIILMTFLTFALPATGLSQDKIKKIDGYGGYKFGMTLEEAKAVRDDSRVEDCKYYTNVYKCIIRDAVFYGEKGQVVVQISNDTRKVNQILVSFNRLTENTEGECLNVLKKILENLLKVYGEEHVSKNKEKRELNWYFPEGGSVTLSNICLTDDVGIVVISYRPSEIL